MQGEINSEDPRFATVSSPKQVRSMMGLHCAQLANLGKVSKRRAYEMMYRAVQRDSLYR